MVGSAVVNEGSSVAVVVGRDVGVLVAEGGDVGLVCEAQLASISPQANVAVRRRVMPLPCPHTIRPGRRPRRGDPPGCSLRGSP